MDEKIAKEQKKARRKHLTERLQAMRQRVVMLEQELNTYTNDFYRVCIFGSARIKPEDGIYKLTAELAKDLGELGIDVLTGGGPGLMEAANKGAKDGRVSSGSKSKSFGITIELNKFEPTSEHLDIKHHHKKFSSRLDDFMRLSNAIVVMKGGIGTLLELYYSWQLLQVGHMPDRPIILIDTPFWQGLIDWMKEQQANGKLMNMDDFRWVHLVNDETEALDIIREDYEKYLKEREVSAQNASGVRTIPATSDDSQ
jgi:uncharacterized protein (TIGR00730 family)